MTATIENIVGLQSAIEHAKSLKPYSNMGISAALVLEMSDNLASQAEENEALRAQVDTLLSLLEKAIPHAQSRRAKGKASYDFLVEIQRITSKLRQAAKDAK